MDVEPIYCAEQIVVPPNLAEVLKAYTKEVIRRQPIDIVDFSAKYFANLSDVASGITNTPAPTKEQLRQVYSRGGAGATLSQAQVVGLCQQAGVADAVIAKVTEAGAFNSAAVDLDKFVFMLLAMSCEDFNRLCLGMFDVFTETGAIQKDRFVAFLAYLAPDMDPEVTPAFLLQVAEDLAGPPTVTYMDVCEAPALRPKLGLE